MQYLFWFLFKNKEIGWGFEIKTPPFFVENLILIHPYLTGSLRSDYFISCRRISYMEYFVLSFTRRKYRQALWEFVLSFTGREHRQILWGFLFGLVCSDRREFPFSNGNVFFSISIIKLQSIISNCRVLYFDGPTYWQLSVIVIGLFFWQVKVNNC